MRDFGALVYRSVINESSRKEKRDKKEDEDSEKKRKKEKKLGGNNAPLLLAYCYFDLSHCNYIASKDLEDLFLTLGLQLSRAQVNRTSSFRQHFVFIDYCVFQVRKLLQKVVTDDSLRYKKLVERAVSPSKEEDDQPSDMPLGNN